MFTRFTLTAVAIFASLTVSNSAFAFGPLCQRYGNDQRAIAAIKTVSHNMQYTPAQLCALPTAYDIQITHTMLTDENQESVPHTWLAIHYSEYTCQYFVKDADQSVTKKNCYSSF